MIKFVAFLLILLLRWSVHACFTRRLLGLRYPTISKISGLNTIFQEALWQSTLWQEYPKLLQDFQCNLVALELERTFWEKATMLHAEYHRDTATPIRDCFSRHYSDMAALAQHAIAKSALTRDDLRQRVANWKSRFFPSTRARYDLARPGTFRLAPPEFRMAELEKDYQAMKDMFLVTPPTFESVIKAVSDLEREINRRQPK